MTKKEKHTEADRMNPTPWIIGMLFVLGLAVLGGLYWNRTGKVQQIQYEGLHFVEQAELQEQIEIPTGLHPDSLDMVGIIQKMEQVPYVKEARLNTQPSGTMVVRITERSPLALLVNGQQRVYVDADGIRLPQVLGKTPDVPLLYGFKTSPMGDTLQSEAFVQTSAFLQELQKRTASDATISEVAWNEREGIIALTNENGVKVTIGKDAFEKRLRNWEAFYREVVRKKGINSIESVDLRFEGQIVTREK